MSMIRLETRRMVGISEIQVIDGKVYPKERPNYTNLLAIRPTTGKESSFVFYDKLDNTVMICHVGFTWQRERLEITCGTEEPFRRNGFMTEALVAVLNWLKDNTCETVAWALPSSSGSEDLIVKLGFTYHGIVEDSRNSKWYVYRLIN